MLAESQQVASVSPSQAGRAAPGQAIPVAEIVSALSFALDLTEDAVPGHALRTCLLGMRLAWAMGLGDTERTSLFYALLLKDIGCSSNAARLHHVMGSDERAVKSAVKFEDWTRPTISGVRTAWRLLRPEAGAVSRFTGLLGLGVHQQRNNRTMIGLRCERGANIVARLGLPPAASVAVRHLDEHWNGSGYPDRLCGEAIPLLSRIMLAAQHLDVFATGRGPEAALASLRARSGRWFDPEVVRVARSLHRAGLLWQTLESEDGCRAAVLDLEPGRRLLATEEQVDSICEAFADVIDIKSSFTGTHSRGVAEAAMVMADTMQLAPERKRFLFRASLLHDLGKLRVPNSILDKPGRLSAEEFAIIREHPGLSRAILARVRHFAPIARVAGEHHERLDGSGYPDGLRAAELSLDSRLVAVADVYGALAEERPYRAGLASEEIRRIMESEAGTRLDSDCYDALVAGLACRKQDPTLVS